MWKIDFPGNRLCSKGMKAIEFYSITKRLYWRTILNSDRKRRRENVM